MFKHKVRQGECISSIAALYGLLPKTVWDDGSNAALKQKRKDPDVLFPGDVVNIPDVRKKEDSAADKQKHTYVRKGVPCKLHVKLKVKGEALKDEPYEVEVEGKKTTGQTGSDGKIDLDIHPSDQNGWIKIRDRIFPVSLGGLDPVDTTWGQQQRLNQLGYKCGPVDGIHGPLTTAGLKAFQKHKGFSESGQPDQQTKDALKQEYGG